MKFNCCYSLLVGAFFLLFGTHSNTLFRVHAAVQVSPEALNLYFVQPNEDAQDVEALFTRPPVAVSVDDVGRPVPSRFVFLLDDVPEDYQETIPNAEDEEAEPIKNELTYIHGILYLEACESGNKWVFESLKSAFQQKDHGDISSKIGEIYSRGINEAQEQAK